MKKTLLRIVAVLSVVNIWANASAETPVQVVDSRRDRNAAPHNAFTDLVRFQDRWFCVFREGEGHVSPDGALRVITSMDGVEWQSAARITSATSDLRDAKISVTPSGQLMLLARSPRVSSRYFAEIPSIARLVLSRWSQLERAICHWRTRLLALAGNLAQRNRLWRRLCNATWCRRRASLFQ